jgi:FSR family fosmidomycin resistance protein-like MFS transporter
MSVYITGGTLGFCLGPLCFAPFAARFGLGWTPLLALPGLAVVGFFLLRVPPIPLHPSAQRGFGALRPYAKPLALLYASVVLRTLTSLTFATFVPVMLTRRGLSVGEAGASVAVYLFGSGIGGFLGGPAADRFGARAVIVRSLVPPCLFMFIAPFLSGWAFVLVLAVGAVPAVDAPVNVTFGQSLAPVERGDGGVVDDGLRLGTGGLSVPLAGGLPTASALNTPRWVSLMPRWLPRALPLPARATASSPVQPAEDRAEARR